jgi:hypothetical protein
MRLGRRACAGVAGAAIAIALAPVPAAQTPAPAVRPALADFLTKHLQFSRSDLAALARGESVAKSMPAADSREVAVAGAVRFDVPVDFYLAKLRDIVAFKKAPDVFRVGVFSTPPVPADLAGLELDPRDIEDLRHCAVGRCDVRLDATALTRFQREVNWKDPKSAAHAHDIARETLARYVAAYQQGGNGALLEYRDANAPVKLADQTRLLMTRSGYLATENPRLRDHLEQYPRVPAAEAEDILYWSKETFGMKPIVTATHLTIWRGATPAADAWVTSKQLYSTHYFDASLAVTLATAVTTPDQPGAYIVYINRSLVDALQGGILGPIKRSIARSKARGGLDSHLVALKKRLESEYKK